MTGYGSLDPEQRLFMSYASTHDVDDARQICEEDPGLRDALDLPAVFATLHEIPGMDLGRFGTLLISADKLLRRFYFYWYVFLRQRRLPLSDIKDLQLDAQAFFFADTSPEMILLEFMKAHLTYREGQTRDAIDILERHMSALNRRGLKDPHHDFVHAVTSSGLGLLQLQIGDFGPAHRNLLRAHQISRRAGFQPSELRDAQRLGELYWATGQYAESLRWHCDPRRRQYAAASRKFDWLLLSHNCAAKVALDDGQVSLTREEIQAGSEVVRDHRGSLTYAQPLYSRLFRAELDSVTGEGDAAGQEIREVIQRFRAILPTHSRGVQDARISLLEHTLRREGLSLDFVTQLDAILDEPRAQDSVVIQIRILLLRSFLYIAGERGCDERTSFKQIDIRFRSELVNDPDLLLAIVVHLYRSAEAGETPQRAELLARRLRELQPVLARSCHEGLYSRLARDELLRCGLFDELADTAREFDLEIV